MSDIEIREGGYGANVMAVEPGGIEAIPDQDRHGKARDLFALWTSPNLEFATIYVGALGMFFGLSFTQAVIGVILGNGLGALFQYFLTQDGPRYGVTQMVLSRAAFGRVGNIFPSISNALGSGIGWFAVNSVSGAFALNTLTHMNLTLSLLIVAIAQVLIAFVGHNLVQTVEKYLMPYLVVVFAIAAIIVFTKHGVSNSENWHAPGAFFLFVGAVFGYSVGWNPFASDYSRYLPKSEDPKKAGMAAALGLLVAPIILEVVGIAAVSAGMHSYGANTNPVGEFTGFLPGWLGKLILIGIVLGSICANVLNIYSGSMSFLAAGVKLKTHWLRASTAILFGVLGYLLAHWAMGNPANNLENFLLVVAYWIGPWLGIMFADRLMRGGSSVQGLLYSHQENPAGPFAFITAVILSVALFADQVYYTGYFPKHNPGLGDIGFFVGFALAFFLYTILHPLMGTRKTGN